MKIQDMRAIAEKVAQDLIDELQLQDALPKFNVYPKGDVCSTIIEYTNESDKGKQKCNFTFQVICPSHWREACIFVRYHSDHRNGIDLGGEHGISVAQFLAFHFWIRSQWEEHWRSTPDGLPSALLDLFSYQSFGFEEMRMLGDWRERFTVKKTVKESYTEISAPIYFKHRYEEGSELHGICDLCLIEHRDEEGKRHIKLQCTKKGQMLFKMELEDSALASELLGSVFFDKV